MLPPLTNNGDKIENEEPNLVDIFHGYDWSKTSLGPTDSWEPVFKATVNLCLQSAFPIAIYAGPDWTLIYNEAWRSILMTNQQHAFGKPAVQVRPKMYDNVLRPKLENIRIKGKGIIENDKYFEFQRNGCFEEAYFSDSFSPLFKSDGSVWGVINTMYDVTQKVLNVQRLKTLEEIRCRTSDAVSLASSCQIMKTVLRNNADIPYALIYLVENNDSKKKSFSSFKSHNAHLAATTFDGDYKNGKVYGKIKRHFPDYFPETPEIIDLSKVIDENYIKQVTSTDSLPICKSWPIHLVLREDKHVNVVLKDGSQAVLLPTKISSSDQKTLSAILICGVNSRRRFDKKYMEFLKLVVSQMNLCLTHGKSMEEQKRSELYANLYSQKDMFFQNICDALQISMTLMSSPLDEVINECPQNTQIMSHLKTIQDNTIQLLKIFSILLQFLSIEINRLGARYCETNVAKLTRELAVNFETLAKIFRLDYKINIPDPTEFDQTIGDKVYLDRDMYKAIMFNLFSNALKRTRSNGYISIHLYLDFKDKKKMIVLEVSDSGIDIPEIVLSNISKCVSYTKSQCSRNYVELYLVKMLVTRHGGDITVTSVANQGTTFKCWFPIGCRHLPINHIYNNFNENLTNQDQKLHLNRQLDSENNDLIIGDYSMDTDNADNIDKMSTDDTISINIPAITTKKKYQILLVNDNADIREDLSSEFDVHHVCSGNAIQKLENINKLPDLILIDIMKINVNEYKLLEILKSDGKTQLIPVILLSTKDVEISSIKGSDKIDDHLIKPFCIRELIARIHANIKLSRLRYKLLLQRRNDEADRLLLSISSKILSRVDLKEILSYIVREIHSLLPCKRISIISCEPSEDISHTIYEDSSNVTSITEPLQLLEIDDNSKSPTSINLQEFLNNNFRVDIFNDIYCDDICENMSMLSVEIRANNDCWGWIKAYRSPNSIWLNSEIELLQEISNQINLASIYAKLYEESLEQDVQIKDAEKANKDKGERLAHTSHELRNPLGAIVGILSSLESTGLDDGDQRDMINIMARASDIVMSIVNDILDAARLEAQKITLINRTFNLLKLLSDTIEHFGERAGNKQIELILSCDVDDLQRYVKSDPDRLGQVLTHLLSNSIKFTEKGEIVMNVTMQSKEVIDEDEESPTCGEIVKRDCLLIEISDTGIGIDPEFIEHIWESFSKGDTSITRRQDGTGLGLSICKKLVAINGGEIKVESHLGKGSKFWLTWNIELLQPLSKYPNISCLGTLFDEEISYLLPHSIRSKRILIIHPVENARNAIAKYLKSIEIVDAFDTLDKGIQKAKDHVELYKQFAYDIIFISLYENNQEEVIKAVSELRKIEKNCNNPLSSLILFIVFPGDKRGALTERVIKNIEGRSKVIYTPVTWQKIISQFSHKCYNDDA